MGHIFKIGAALVIAAATIMIEPSYAKAEAQTITDESYRELLEDLQEFKPNGAENLAWLREACSVVKEKEDQKSETALADGRSYMPPPGLPCYGEYGVDIGS